MAVFREKTVKEELIKGGYITK
jgi:hypothetical protein